MDNISNAKHDIARIIAEIDERGFCVIPSVITPEEADEARAALERLLAEEATEGTWPNTDPTRGAHRRQRSDLPGTDDAPPDPRALERRISMRM